MQNITSDENIHEQITQIKTLIGKFNDLLKDVPEMVLDNTQPTLPSIFSTLMAQLEELERYFNAYMTTSAKEDTSYTDESIVQLNGIYTEVETLYNALTPLIGNQSTSTNT